VIISYTITVDVTERRAHQPPRPAVPRLARRIILAARREKQAPEAVASQTAH
jgi:hypothetical protein